MSNFALKGGFRLTVVIYELEDKMWCISKLQIDRDFWPVLYIKHDVQEYET